MVVRGHSFIRKDFMKMNKKGKSTFESRLTGGGRSRDDGTISGKCVSESFLMLTFQKSSN